MVKKIFKILVVGCGSVGQRHARLLSNRDDVDLYTADTVGANLEECRNAASVKEEFADYKDGLAKKMDGVIICTPNEMHADMALHSLSSGACVLIEKPVAVSVEEACKLKRYEKAPKSRVLVGYMNRFNSQLQEIKDMADQGVFGNIVYASACVYTYPTLIYARTDYRLSSKWSLILDYTHEIDFLRFILGEVKEVAAMADVLGELEKKPVPNVLELILRFDNRAIGHVHMDYVRDPDKRMLELVGDKASVEFYLNEGIIRIYNKERKGYEERRIQFIRDELFIRQIDNFIGMIREEQEPMVSLNDGIEVLRIAEAAIKSCSERRFVNVR